MKPDREIRQPGLVVRLRERFVRDAERYLNQHLGGRKSVPWPGRRTDGIAEKKNPPYDGSSE